jgi:probable rRNA maturation factor
VKAKHAVRIADLQGEIRLPAAFLKKLALRVMARERLRAGELSIAFVDRASMRKLNRRYLRHDFDTDVLAFPLEDPLVGELIVSTGFARREAERRGIPVKEEVARYVVHGILHLAGYDDHDPADKARMWKRQESHLTASGR